MLHTPAIFLKTKKSSQPRSQNQKTQYSPGGKTNRAPPKVAANHREMEAHREMFRAYEIPLVSVPLRPKPMKLLFSERALICVRDEGGT